MSNQCSRWKGNQLPSWTGKQLQSWTSEQLSIWMSGQPAGWTSDHYASLKSQQSNWTNKPLPSWPSKQLLWCCGQWENNGGTEPANSCQTKQALNMQNKRANRCQFQQAASWHAKLATWAACKLTGHTADILIWPTVAKSTERKAARLNKRSTCKMKGRTVGRRNERTAASRIRN